MTSIALADHDTPDQHVSGEFVSFAGERYYAIHNVDRMAPFFISVVSSDDHWLFASSTGGLAAGRVSPDYALFPYITDDRIHESTGHTGSKTIVRLRVGAELFYWEPFNREHDGLYPTSRNIYKNALGNKLCFEETNHDLGLTFRCAWSTSAEFGFVRSCELENLGTTGVVVELVDGLQNILPAGTPPVVQRNASNLVNAYKWSELDESTGLAFLTLYSGISDRAEPCESLRATTVFSLGLDERRVLISSGQLNDFRDGKRLQQESHRRGIRGAYLVNTTLEIAPLDTSRWQIVANLEQSQKDVVALRHSLRDPADVAAAISASVAAGSDRLARIMASADGLQTTAGENETVHHYANVLFNVMRGGNFHDQYNVSAKDFRATLQHFNSTVYERSRALLDTLPDSIRLDTLLHTITSHGDMQLERLAREYLPLTFGRRHGDPSRPWNHFEIRIKDEHGAERLSYQGNWRDIFQNWEALTFSYPGFIDSVIAKFVNASTVDGYNPYRIGKDGIDWELEEPDDPWSYIGYWGDHQIIYLEKLLELSRNFNPGGLHELLRRPIFSYANVPYRIKAFDDLLANPKSTVVFDTELAETIDGRVAELGADGKLVLDMQGEVCQVNLLEKLLVPLLSKLGNLVINGGIWLNTQRPEWNDANNALVGHGLSMVTLCYIRRYVGFLQDILGQESAPVELSGEIAAWLDESAAALRSIRAVVSAGPVTDEQRLEALTKLGRAAENYRLSIYRKGTFSAPVAQQMESLREMLSDTLAIVDLSIAANRRDDGLFHAYNLLNLRDDSAGVDHLYPMLEGQVAALSASTLAPDEAISVIEALFASAMYREDQRSFMLYPDRQLPGFLERNRMSAERVASVQFLAQMLAAGDHSIVYRDADGWCRFNADIINADSLNSRLDQLAQVHGEIAEAARIAILDLYEEVFNHRAFTGRSGTMFGYEGLGSIYWHMVSKLLLAVQENFYAALEDGADKGTSLRLAELYYRVREGIGFNKTPAEYGAFPTDPYSHTPKHVGASQPGMTGQVKEEVLTRFGELGIRVRDGAVRFSPALLRAEEFLRQPREFRYLDVAGNWRDLDVPENGLAFTWCQVPVIYRLSQGQEGSVTTVWDNGQADTLQQLALHADVSAEIFRRSGRVQLVTVEFGADLLLGD